jgi:hypothetical protein
MILATSGRYPSSSYQWRRNNSGIAALPGNNGHVNGKLATQSDQLCQVRSICQADDGERHVAVVS